jgi:hypothetical protein
MGRHTRRTLFGAILCWCACSLGSALCAEDPNALCAVPEELSTVNYPLNHVRSRLMAKEPLRVLVLGSSSSTGSSAWASRGLVSAFKAYPRLLEGELTARMPGLRVSVLDKAAPGLTVSMIVAQLDGNLLQGKPDLVVWEAGTTDAVRRLDVNVFGEVLTDGLRNLHNRGIDVLLVDIQYSPQTDSIYDFQPYLDYLRRVGEAEDINVLRRFDIMRLFTDDGRFDPAASSPAEQMRNANFAHGCLAKQLAQMILSAAQDKP